MLTLGKHLIIEISDVAEPSMLRDATFLDNLLRTAAEKSGATTLNSFFHHFGGDHGVTGVVALAESHISIHTWPEHGYAAIDIFVCGKCNPVAAQDYIQLNLAGNYRSLLMERGFDKKTTTNVIQSSQK